MKECNPTEVKIFATKKFPVESDPAVAETELSMRPFVVTETVTLEFSATNAREESEAEKLPVFRIFKVAVALLGVDRGNWQEPMRSTAPIARRVDAILTERSR